jgi:hypothetical protein
MNMLARTARSSKMRALLCAALPTLLFSAILPALTPSVYAQASTPESHAETPIIARAARGSVGSIEITYRDGPLQAKPLRDANAPVLVRVTTLGADRFRVDYIGSITGTFDLRPAIERADGRTPDGLGSLSVEIFSQLPAEAGTDVFGLSAAGFDVSATYTTALWTIAAVWVAIPAFVLIRRAIRRKPAPLPVPSAHEPTTAELLFAAVDAARTRELTAEERGQLELRLLQILRRGAPASDVGEAVAVLRADPRTGEIVRAVEAWLHAPEGGDAARALAEVDALRTSATKPAATGDLT